MGRDRARRVSPDAYWFASRGLVAGAARPWHPDDHGAQWRLTPDLHRRSVWSHVRSPSYPLISEEVVMSRATTQLCIAAALATAIVISAPKTLQAQTTAKPAAPAAQKPPPAAPMKMAAAPKMTDAQKIVNAEAAAPADIAKKATIMDWAEGGDMTKPPRQLRAGTNGWVCYPKTPSATSALGEDPMCFDKAWQGWAEGYMSKTTPKVATTGIAYMLKGDKGASNTDPYASAPTPTNQWVISPSHIMVLLPDTKMLDNYPTDPKNGGPWGMWKGTPYPHLMVPISATKAPAMTGK